MAVERLSSSTVRTCVAPTRFLVIQPLVRGKAALLSSVIVMKIDVMIDATTGVTIVAMIVVMTGVITDVMIEVAAIGNNARKKTASAIFMVVRSYATEPKGVL